MLTALWMQCGACGGDTMSLLGMESPHLPALLDELQVELLWHPSLSNGSPAYYQNLISDLRRGRRPLDLLLVEGFVSTGPEGSGAFDTFKGEAKADILTELAARAGVVLAVGTCASFGGIGKLSEIDAVGLQFHHQQPGGLLGRQFRSTRGWPVINIPGCPVHPTVLKDVLYAACEETAPPLNAFQAPEDWFGVLVHQGCTRNEYHEYRVEDDDFGGPGCMFFHLGCRGPLTYSPCNKILWNNRNSKTNAGTPCFGCTHPDFPQEHPFFHTPSIIDIPLELPDGVDRAHYLAYKGMAAAAAPERLVKRTSKV
ncbi:NADH:ubiquinone oxidoreductase [Desulfobulbus alkaliphilus]|uniref:NADH-quinone oxidoreductase subunit B family protein n=1 Tax=Desulfobulbus alkaliphilus TaxID=869814 RepID=UPI001962D300|nr:NADH:ubiquinone oxidoreductase [Desulfobulbus alkaliphilus]MBM9538406.1 NADH:ubiquinone oxidoreductase [Desulfobulbus alkaliphilus]